jgi:hypothetical protein
MKAIYKYFITLISFFAAGASITFMFSKLIINQSFVIQIGTTLAASIIAVYLGYIFIYYKNRRHKIFISYNYNDSPIAQKLSAILRSNGFKVFNLEESVYAGENIKEKINNLIEASSIFLVIISSSSLTSNWINNELSQALKLKKPIIPLRIDDSKIPDKIQMIKYIDFKDNDDSVKFLIKSIKNLQGYI